MDPEIQKLLQESEELLTKFDFGPRPRRKPKNPTGGLNQKPGKLQTVVPLALEKRTNTEFFVSEPHSFPVGRFARERHEYPKDIEARIEIFNYSPEKGSQLLELVSSRRFKVEIFLHPHDYSTPCYKPMGCQLYEDDGRIPNDSGQDSTQVQIQQHGLEVIQPDLRFL